MAGANGKLSKWVYPVTVINVGGRTYRSQVQAAKQMARSMADRVMYVLNRTGNPKASNWHERRKMEKRLAKRAYPIAKLYVGRWVR